MCGTKEAKQLAKGYKLKQKNIDVYLKEQS